LHKALKQWKSEISHLIEEVFMIAHCVCTSVSVQLLTWTWKKVN